MQYSRRGLSKVLYRLSSISGSKQVMVFFNSPTIEFALPTALVICLDGFKLLEMKTPRCFSSVVSFNGVVPRWYS